MNDKDAFDRWWDNERGGKPLNGDHISVTEKQLYQWETEAWQAACEYKQLKLAHHIYKIELENALLNQEIEKFKGYLEAWRIDE